MSRRITRIGLEDKDERSCYCEEKRRNRPDGRQTQRMSRLQQVVLPSSSFVLSFLFGGRAGAVTDNARPSWLSATRDTLKHMRLFFLFFLFFYFPADYKSSSLNFSSSFPSLLPSSSHTTSSSLSLSSTSPQDTELMILLFIVLPAM